MSRLIAPEFPRWYQDPATWESGPNSAYFKALMTALTDEPIRLRAALAQSTNPLSATRQPKKVAEALRRLDLYVVHDTHWNPSCAFADYVLPACTQYECSQQFAVKNFPEGTFVAINQKIAEPPGEACSDWDFYLRLAVAMGYGADFWGGSMDACLREQLEGSGVTLEQLRAAPEGIFVERPAGERPREARSRRYRELFAGLPQGKVQCANALLAGRPTADETGVLGALPEYAGPPEGIAETPELLDAYPLAFSDVHAYRWCNHGYFSSVPYLREHQPLPWVRMHPETAAAHGVADGDWVRVESPHGWVKLVAETTPTIPPGVLMARRGWWQACAELGLPGYGCLDGGSECAVLYASDPARSDAFHSAMAKQTLVRMGVLGKGGGVGAERVASKAPAGAVGAPTAASAGAGVATVEGRASAADAGAPAGVGAATAETAAPTGAGAAVPVALSRNCGAGTPSTPRAASAAARAWLPASSGTASPPARPRAAGWRRRPAPSARRQTYPLRRQTPPFRWWTPSLRQQAPPARRLPPLRRHPCCVRVRRLLPALRPRARLPFPGSRRACVCVAVPRIAWKHAPRRPCRSMRLARKRGEGGCAMCYPCVNCGKCGSKLPEAKIRCPKCKTALDESHPVCETCGWRLPLPPGAKAPASGGSEAC